MIERFKTNRNGKYIFLNQASKKGLIKSMMPTQKVKVLALMTLWRMQSYLVKDVPITISDVTEEFDIHKARASQVLNDLVRKGHMTVNRYFIPYQFKLTEQGKSYGEHIWENMDYYNLNRYEYRIQLIGYYPLSHPYHRKKQYQYHDEWEHFTCLYDAIQHGKDLYHPYNKNENETNRSYVPDYMLDDMLDDIIENECEGLDEREIQRKLLRLEVSTDAKFDHSLQKKWEKDEEYRKWDLIMERN